MGHEAGGPVLRAQHTLSIVVCTYEWPEALDLVLWALSEQSDPDFDVVVADDGSSSATADTVARWRRVFGTRLEHVWQPDEGFRAARARNLGALSCASDLLVFLDGDCVPRRNFARAARACAQRGWFAIGRRLHLSPEVTARVLNDRPPIHRWPVTRCWIEAQDHAEVWRLTARDRRRVGRLGVPEFVPHSNAYSPFLVRAMDFEQVNGYDMSYEGWGEEDVDLAVRLRRLGLRCGHTGPAGTVVHLWHAPQSKRDRPNWWRVRGTEHSGALAATLGLRELEELVAAPGHVLARR
jgi:glycosyltransferase involved in cell wall biosynthesis